MSTQLYKTQVPLDLPGPAFIFLSYNNKSIPGKVVKFLTGSYAYHMGFYVPGSDNIYDMNLLFRKLPNGLSRLTPGLTVMMPCPVLITEDMLKQAVFDGVNEFCSGGPANATYGFKDYLAFFFRGVYKYFGNPTPNFKGKICSEKVNDILVEHGWSSPFTTEVPSPADFARYFNVEDPV